MERKGELRVYEQMNKCDCGSRILSFIKKSFPKLGIYSPQSEQRMALMIAIYQPATFEALRSCYSPCPSLDKANCVIRILYHPVLVHLPWQGPEPWTVMIIAPSKHISMDAAY
jgi:hypothetical protein